jgi:hypothetical protein
VSAWFNLYEAFTDVAQGIRVVAENLKRLDYEGGEEAVVTEFRSPAYASRSA